MSMRSFFCCAALMLVFLGPAGSVWAQAPDVPSQGNQRPPDAPPPGMNLGSSGTQNPLLGGVPTGKPTEGVLPLSLADTLARALKYNLGALLSGHSLQAARGARLLALSELLPRVTAGVRETGEQVNLAGLGFRGFPGMSPVIGPFNVFDTRAYLSQPVLDFGALNRARAAAENVKAAEFSNTNTRDLVVFVCGNLYLQAVASESRIEAARAQVNTASALYTLAVDQKAAGVVPAIEVLRAQVELQAQQQRLIVAEDQFAKDKLALARAIGLPLGQEFTLIDRMLYSPFPIMTLDEAVERAYRDRPDYQGAMAQVQAAKSNRKAAQAGRLPSLDFNADYGIIGQRPWQNHGTFTVAANLRIPLFQGGSVRGRVLEADAAWRQREAELEDLRGRIYYEIRNAFLDLKAADDRIRVAESALKLANDQVQQAQDRFGAGVTGNIEVVQAQEALATASENYISSRYAHSAAKLALARALGIAEDAYQEFLRGK